MEIQGKEKSVNRQKFVGVLKSITHNPDIFRLDNHWKLEEYKSQQFFQLFLKQFAV